MSRAASAIVRDDRTPEGRRNRGYLIGGAPVELAGSALGVLIANGHITATMAKAADEYARLRAVSFGISRPAVAFDMVEPRSARLRSEARLVELRRFFEAMVGRISWEQKEAVDQLVVDGALPGWFIKVRLDRRLSRRDEAERAALLDGLAALARR